MSAPKVADENARGLATTDVDAGDAVAHRACPDHPCQTRIFEESHHAGRKRVASSERDGNPKGRDPKGLCAQHDSPAPKGLAKSRLAIVEHTTDGIILRYILKNISAACLKLGYLRLQLPDRHFEIVPHVEVTARDSE